MTMSRSPDFAAEIAELAARVAAGNRPLIELDAALAAAVQLTATLINSAVKQAKSEDEARLRGSIVGQVQLAIARLTLAKANPASEPNNPVLERWS